MPLSPTTILQRALLHVEGRALDRLCRRADWERTVALLPDVVRAMVDDDDLVDDPVRWWKLPARLGDLVRQEVPGARAALASLVPELGERLDRIEIRRETSVDVHPTLRWRRAQLRLALLTALPDTPPELLVVMAGCWHDNARIPVCQHPRATPEVWRAAWAGAQREHGRFRRQGGGVEGPSRTLDALVRLGALDALPELDGAVRECAGVAPAQVVFWIVDLPEGEVRDRLLGHLLEVEPDAAAAAILEAAEGGARVSRALFVPALARASRDWRLALARLFARGEGQPVR